MRLGVLDVGSNTVHLLVVDAHRGGHPNPMRSEKTQLRLAEHVEAGQLTRAGASGLVGAVARAKAAAMKAGCEELLAFATSALRDANNSAAVLSRVWSAMRALKVGELQICPWALREGVILHRLDTLGLPSPSQRPWPLTDRHLTTRHQPRTSPMLSASRSQPRLT
jgi:exopolyphosphatase/pppGpp-phosphohydrolase